MTSPVASFGDEIPCCSTSVLIVFFMLSSNTRWSQASLSHLISSRPSIDMANHFLDEREKQLTEEGQSCACKGLNSACAGKLSKLTRRSSKSPTLTALSV